LAEAEFTSNNLTKVFTAIKTFDVIHSKTHIEYNEVVRESVLNGWTTAEFNAIPDSRKPSFLMFPKGIVNIFEDVKYAVYQTARMLGQDLPQSFFDENLPEIQ
jgi:hypothetical protein